MYDKAYGIIETLAPLHVGASSGEESGNLNLIFRDQFTQTGIIPGSSIRGRFRADLRLADNDFANLYYGNEAILGQPDSTSEASVKFEYASLLWLPVFCPGQPVVYITCPRLLKRYYQIVKSTNSNFPRPNQAKLHPHRNVLFFNLGFIDNLTNTPDLDQWIPQELENKPTNLLVVEDAEMGIIHDMALFRQSRVKLKDEEKIVDSDKGGFFNTEALPEGTILIFPIAIKTDSDWQEGLDLSEWEKLENKTYQKELYFGGLESIGFGRTQVTLNGQYFQ
jgi:CRISPR-associated protein Cmr4